MANEIREFEKRCRNWFVIGVSEIFSLDELGYYQDYTQDITIVNYLVTINYLSHQGVLRVLGVIVNNLVDIS